MMDLLEYQAKSLFREVGIPVLPSQYIDDPRKIKQVQLPYPLVLKSQVRAGGREKAGGIRFVENTIDAIAAARAIFSLPILGEYPQVLLAETRYNAQQELFLAIVLDYQLQRPVLLGSTQGGLQVETAGKKMRKVAIEDDFSPFYARRLAIAMGLKNGLIKTVSAIVEKMYRLFVTKDLNSIEINPLGIDVRGKAMALDGKIAIDDDALNRHPEFVALTQTKPRIFPHNGSSIPRGTSPGQGLNSRPCWVDRRGEIGILCNGVGLGMATWDLLVQEGGNPSYCWTIGSGAGGTLWPDDSLVEEFEKALGQLMAAPEVKVILINILSSPAVIERLARAIAAHFCDEPEGPRSEEESSMPPLVVRLAGGEMQWLATCLDALPLHWTDNLEGAVAQTIALC